ncbi:MAG: ABC transporter permease [Bacteroidota bacterium]|nr:ABC transporter permease [Bacteroidota bacterium]
MFKNYVKTALRNLWKNKGYSLLNIGGLAIGIACAGLIFLWVEDELSYNDYFPNRENLYKIKDRQTYNGQTFTFDATPGPLAAGIKADIPGIKSTARTTWGNSLLFSKEGKSLYENGLYADPSFLKMFHLHFVSGNSGSAFDQLHSLVVTEKMALKFFGTTDVIGKTLLVNKKDNYMISGVISNLPENVSFQFEWLAPFKNFEESQTWLRDWGSNGVRTFVELEPGASVDQINQKLYNYVATKSDGAIAKMSIYPMARWRMYDSFENGKEVPGRIKFVHLFSLIAWIILIIACINFMNMSTARSEKRAKEVGVRKVVGAGRNRLVGQFIGESLITSLLAAVIAIGIIALALPAFNQLVNKSLTLRIIYPPHIIALLGIALICGLIAGSYPAFYLSSFRPAFVLKGMNSKGGGSAGWIRKGLVILQFSISVILIISTLIIYQQITHVKDRDLGYNKSHLLYMYMQGDMKSHFEAIKNELEATGTVENACLSNDLVLQMVSNSGGFSWEGKAPDKDVLITTEGISPEFISTMGMTLTAGRNFNPDINSDSLRVLINQSLAKVLNKKEVLGTLISWNNQQYTVVGVVKDFIYNDMYGSAAPAVFFSDTSNCNVLSIRTRPDVPVQKAIAAIGTVIKSENPGYPFEYNFVDKEFDQLFRTETLIGKLAAVFSVLAILISCLGLFGLAAYTAERRTKEIGIRKVLGAKVHALAGLLSREFLVLVGISCLIAFPISGWMMHDWLSGYAYRIQIHWIVFFVAGILALLIALLTVSFQAIKAASANPIKSLRSE